MELEQYSYLWAKDSEWVLRPRGDTHLIHLYSKDGTMSALVIEDDTLRNAIIAKMKSEGIRIINDEEADELWEKMQDINRAKAEKSKKLIEVAKKKLEGNQFIKDALKELLNNLDEVANLHPEIHDTAVRELLNDAIVEGFVLNTHTPDTMSNNYAMFSDEGNDAVHEAIMQFLQHPEVVAALQELTIPEERLTIFQDHDVKSSEDNEYDWYFGWIESLIR